MSENQAVRKNRRRPSAAQLAIVFTLAACLTALAFRAPLRARYWAWRLSHAATRDERDVYLRLLINAGAQGRWGTLALLTDPRADVRQYGVLILQHVRAPWAQEALLAHLSDTDADVQRLAALGLAWHGDDRVVPALLWHYRTGDTAAATAACLALERLGTHAASEALFELAAEPADVVRRAALVDALAGINRPACGPALLRLLDDHRVCTTPRAADELARRAVAALQAEGQFVQLASRPAMAETVAERAADALARLTGVAAEFSSSAPPEQRAAAVAAWQAWVAEAKIEP